MTDDARTPAPGFIAPGVDGYTCVARLEDVRWTLYESRPVEQLGSRVVATPVNGWAVVAIALRRYRDRRWREPELVLARYRKLGLYWRLHDSFGVNTRQWRDIAAATTDLARDIGFDLDPNAPPYSRPQRWG